MELASINKLYTLDEAADWLKISPRRLKKYAHKGLCPYHQLGAKIFFTEECLTKLLNNTKKSSACLNETAALALNGSKNEIAITSSGQKMVAAASAARALEIGQKLKKSSRNSSYKEQPLEDRIVRMKC